MPRAAATPAVAAIPATAPPIFRCDDESKTSSTPCFQLPNPLFKLSRLDCLAVRLHDRGDSAGFIGRQLTGSHSFRDHAEGLGDVEGRLDWRQIECDRAAFADRDKPLDAKTHCCRIALLGRADDGSHNILGVVFQ